MDRHEELMLGLYQGFVPTWLPNRSRELFERESLRRRCALGQSLVSGFRCTVYCAQALFSEDIVHEVYAAWPGTRFSAQNVSTGLYFALDEVLRAIEGASAVRDLLHYEAMAVAELCGSPRAVQLTRAQVLAAGLGEIEVYRFDHAVPEFHARMTLYSGSLAPAEFIRTYEVPQQTTYVGRVESARGWIIQDLTSNFDPPNEIGEIDDGRATLH